MVTITNLRKDGTLSWLHLSDIHFGEAQGTGRDAVLNRLIDDVRGLRERDELTPDLIFITGDIAWSGKPDQYQRHALPFLEKLQAAADVEPSRIFLIPGNHDVDRSQIKSIALKKFQEELIVPPAGENDQKFVTEFLTSAKYQNDRKNLLLKHKAYIKFVTKHFPHCKPEIVPGAYTCPVELPKGALPFEKLWVVGLNTAWLGRDGEDKGKLLLGYEQIQQALNVIEKDGSWSRDFILALTHHPLSWLPEWDERLCQQQIETRCDFHLSGHLHETHFNLRGVGGPQRCSEIAAGSAYGGSQWYNGYNLVELDFQTGKGRAMLRRYEPSITAWTLDPRFIEPQPGQFTWDLNNRFRKSFTPASGTPSKPESSDSGASPTKDLFGQYRALLADTTSKVRLFGDRNTHPLEKVFVELTIFEEYESPCVRAEWEGLMDLALRERRDWFRRDGNQAKNEEDPESSKTRVKTRHTVKPDELLNPGKRVFVAGAPGSGKSTLLRYLANKVAQENHRWPVFLELKTLLDTLGDLTENRLAEFAFTFGVLRLIQRHFDFTSAEQTALHQAFLENWKQGNVVLCLDGLDEVESSPFFAPLRQLIEGFAQVQSSKNVVIVSSRPFTFQPLAHLEAMEIAPLNDQQIVAFLEHYQGEAVAKKLNQEFGRHRDMHDLARSPFMLAVITNLFTNQELVISSKLELYRRIVFDFVTVLDAEKRVKRFHLDDPKGALKREFLQFIAFERFFEQETDGLSKRLVFTGDELVTLARRFHPEVNEYHLAADVQATPLLREVGPNVFAFSHLTIQEYLAAVALATHQNCEKLFCRACFNPEFTDKLEVLPMTLGLVSKPEMLYAALENLPESLTYINLRLRARGLAYVEKLKDEQFALLMSRLVSLIRYERREETPYSEAIRQSYSGASDNFRGKITSVILSLLRDELSYVRARAAGALGQLGVGSEAVVMGLLERLWDEDSDVRARAAGVLGQLGVGSEAVVTGLLGLLRDESWNVRERAAGALGQLGVGNEAVVTALLGLLRDEYSDVRERAAGALGQLGVGNEAVVMGLLGLLRDELSYVRARAAGALGQLGVGSEAVVMGLLGLLRDEDWNVRARAAGVLGQLGVGSEAMVMGLLGRLRDEDSDVRARAAGALGELGVGNEAMVTGLLGLLRDESWNVRARAAGALGQLGVGSEAVVMGLLERLWDEDSDVRARAAGALGQLGVGSEAVVMGLLGLLRDESWNVRERAAEALGQLGVGSEAVVMGLLERLWDEDSDVRARAAGALGQLGVGNEAVVTALVGQLRYEDWSVRASAAEALGQLTEHQLALALPKVLLAEESFVRSKAAETVGYYSEDPQVLDELHRVATSDLVEEVRQVATAAHKKYTRKLQYFDKAFI